MFYIRIISTLTVWFLCGKFSELWRRWRSELQERSRVGSSSFKFFFCIFFFFFKLFILRTHGMFSLNPSLFVSRWGFVFYSFCVFTLFLFFYANIDFTSFKFQSSHVKLTERNKQRGFLTFFIRIWCVLFCNLSPVYCVFFFLVHERIIKL